jgi:hypothetical protein
VKLYSASELKSTRTCRPNFLRSRRRSRNPTMPFVRKTKRLRRDSGALPGMDEATLRQTTQRRIAAERDALQQIKVERNKASEYEAIIEEDKQRRKLANIKRLGEEREKVERAVAERIAQIQKDYGPAGGPNAEAGGKLITDAWEEANSKLDEIDRKLAEERRKLAVDTAKERLQQLKIEESAIKKAEDSYRTMQGQINAGRREVLATIGEIGGNLMQVARGLVAIGLAGEEDMQKVVQGLLKVQGAFDLVNGGIQVFLKMEKAVESVKNMLNLTVAAEEALATASAIRQGIQGAGGASGAARGAAGRVAGDVAGTVVGGALSTQAGRAGRLARNLMRSGGGAVRMAGTVGRVGGTLAAGGVLAGLGADLAYGGGEFRQGGFGQRFFSMGQGMSSRVDQYLGLDTESRRLADSNDQTARIEQSTAQAIARNQSQAARVDESIGGIRAGFGARARVASGTLSLDLAGKSAKDQEARIAKEILETEQKIAEVKEAGLQTAGRFESLITEYSQEQLRLEQTKRDLTEQRATIARDSAAAELEASKRSLDNVERTLEAQQQTLMTMQQQLASSRERFGLMDSEQQGQLLDIFQRGSAGEELSVEELRMLKSLGSKAADAIVAAQAERRAEMGGASAIFGEEQAGIDKLAADIATNVDVATEIRWNIEFDQQALNEQAEALDKIVRDNLKSQLDGVMSKVEESLAGVVAGIRVRIDGLDQRMMDGAGGRN